MNFLTDFADQAVILPLVAAVALVLWIQRRWRVALSWLLVVPAVLGTMLALKIVGHACSWLWPALGPDQLALSSPSGHAASAAVVYGGIAALLMAGVKAGAAPTARMAALLTAFGIAALIGTTRVELGAHSLAEVVVAAAIGIAGAMAFARAAGREIAARSGVPVMAGVVVIIVLFHGRHLSAEAAIQNTAAEALRRWVTACEPP